MGKTAWAMACASHVVFELKQPAVVFELEMAKQQLVKRLISSEGRVDGQRVRTGKLLDSDWPKLAARPTALPVEALHRRPRRDDDGDMRARCRRVRQKQGDLGLVVVDYLHLIASKGPMPKREQAVAEFSRGLKLLARELECPVMALAQLNRGLRSARTSAR
jgi:replicative DNA helicase